MINGSIKLFRAFGIDVFLHWSWFIVAVLLIPNLGGDWFTGPGATPMMWSALLYISLFAIVVLHEFGHALACLSVGGKAKHIVLWPLGGVAFVQPPQRPGAVLWSIVAGPLVNVMLVPVTILVYFAISGGLGQPKDGNNLEAFFFAVMLMNFGLLVFNMLPIYPLDGGQTLMSILWFFIGRAMALQIVGVIGLIGAGVLLLIALFFGELLMIALAAFVGLQAFGGFRTGLLMAKTDSRHYDERHAERAVKDDLDQRIQEQVDPWRR